MGKRVGSVPYLPQLKELDLSGNYDLHPDLTRMFKHQWPKLKTLVISDTNLRSLELYGNSIKGYIHSSISSLKSLDSLDFSFNNFQGFIPKSICEMFSLRRLILSGNNVTGTIPNCLYKLKHLSVFDVKENFIEGSVCSKDSEFTTLFIDLSHNRLSGIIPSSIGNCSKLLSLNLGKNNLTGHIPNELEQVKSLRYLQLQDNFLDGTLVFNFFSIFADLEVLSLANNNFRGSIPTEFGSYNVLKIISLRSNKFQGTIPDEISYCQNLQILDLSKNNLTGIIPRQIGNSDMLSEQKDQKMGYIAKKGSFMGHIDS
ncbi:receptor kinase-like protein Xa21 [Papaver somniferum]|uniref:receptor kinase-like protein Xa21 n=1 Tax=Papaver somniferum TaxID=3469 RepID=UPI000E7018EB|nr:receptor kinase-like protein Xa21 [Papaver somniferum]